jgi:hypothetical protein
MRPKAGAPFRMSAELLPEAPGRENRASASSPHPAGEFFAAPAAGAAGRKIKCAFEKLAKKALIRTFEFRLSISDGVKHAFTPQAAMFA